MDRVEPTETGTKEVQQDLEQEVERLKSEIEDLKHSLDPHKIKTQTEKAVKKALKSEKEREDRLAQEKEPSYPAPGEPTSSPAPSDMGGEMEPPEDLMAPSMDNTPAGPPVPPKPTRPSAPAEGEQPPAKSAVAPPPRQPQKASSENEEDDFFF